MVQHSIVWLDVNSSDSISSFRSKLGNAKTFTDVDTCIQYIQSHPYEFIYLIVSGSLAKQAVPIVYKYSNLLQIFLFCGSIAGYAEWGMNYFEKLLIFDHEDDLLERLWNDLSATLRKEATLCLTSSEEYRLRALQYRRPCG